MIKWGTPSKIDRIIKCYAVNKFIWDYIREGGILVYTCFYNTTNNPTDKNTGYIDTVIGANLNEATKTITSTPVYATTISP